MPRKGTYNSEYMVKYLKDPVHAQKNRDNVKAWKEAKPEKKKAYNKKYFSRPEVIERARLNSNVYYWTNKQKKTSEKILFTFTQMWDELFRVGEIGLEQLDFDPEEYGYKQIGDKDLFRKTGK